MTEFHRRIELQSPEDLQHLILTTRRAANKKIDKDLPPIEGDDPIRTRVEGSAAENITINGLGPSASLLANSSASNAGEEELVIEEHEPFDSRLFEKLKELARQEEDLTEDIAALRRRNPGLVVEREKREWREGMEVDDEVLRACEEGMRGVSGEGLAIGQLERQMSVESGWKRGVQGLERLKSTLPETVARKERAERAKDYVLRTEEK